MQYFGKLISCHWCLKMVSLLFLIIIYFLISITSFFLKVNRL
ncbi:DUF1360 domain-containing protein [Bacteroides oleiciplenus]|uniref:DUF1360 domain-containing protein n=1 Tax=Bacteroides oleiciplenus TaxID=626931 RepID=A0A3E5AV14_9BACE|nr:DUF1360 domain-containing protein [Bacteroides oleiciplenus]